MSTTPPNPAQPGLSVSMTLNGAPITVTVHPHERLLDTLRDRLAMTGSKEGCGEGECGACTVHVDGLPANACLIPTFQCRGRSITTIESVNGESLRPMLEAGATQCGACTPGVVMTAQWVRANPHLLKEQTPRELMAGNLCRCTGYDGIIDGLARSMQADAAPGGSPPCA